MSDTSNIEQDSVVEYSLSEIGFILVFVLLLLSAWEINENFEQLEEKSADILILEEKITEKDYEILVLKEIISKVDGGQEWKDDMELVSKSERLIDKQTIEDLQNQVNNLQEAYDDQAAENQEQENINTDSKTNGEGLLAGDVGFCTYAAPTSDSLRLYGRSLAIGTIVIGEDYLTLVDKNLSIAKSEVVDIAGKPYDTTLVLDAIQRWPLNVPLTPKKFRELGREFVEIGNIPSDHRVACRFGMDWYKESYTKKSDFNFLRVFQNAFFVNDELSDDQVAPYLPLKKSDKDILETQEPEFDELKFDSERHDSASYEKIKYSAPEKLRGLPPNFPAKANRRGIKGYAKLKYVVDSRGFVRDIEILEESHSGVDFGVESIRALKKWRFRPAETDGIPVLSPSQEIRFVFK